MTDEKPKRAPAGAAVAGAVQRPVNYPKTLVVMVSEETHAAIEKTRQEYGVNKADIARDWLEAGRKGTPAEYTDES